MKKILKEDDLYKVDQVKRFEEITDPYLRTAAAAGCFGTGFEPASSVPDFPDIKAVQQVKQDASSGKPVIAFHTNIKSKKYEGHTLTYVYTGSPGNYVFIKPFAYKCKQLQQRSNPDFLSGISQELHDLLIKPVSEGGLGYKPYGDVKGPEIFEYELVNLNTDKDLKEGGRYYSKVQTIPQFFETIKNQGLDIFLWKPALKSGPVLDMKQKQNEVLEFYKQKGFVPCADGQFNPKQIASVDLSKDYPQSFKPGYRVCKKWTDISSTKQDCRAVIDSYYEEIEKYSRGQGRIQPDPDFINTMKPQVNACIASNDGKMPLRNKEMKFMKSLRASSPFFLGESTDRLTNIIRESLSVVKMRKNSI